MSRLRRNRFQIDALTRDLAAVGLGALLAWSAIQIAGTVAGYFSVEPMSTLRFLLAVLILLFSRNLYFRFHQWRLRKVTPDERYGFVATSGAVAGTGQAER
jgi:hypothetical protein